MPQIRGLKYPLQVKNGNLEVSEDVASVRDQIVSVLETRPFERVMAADYGTPDQVFDTLNPQLVNSRIRYSIEKEVENLTSLTVLGDWSKSEEGLYILKIIYEVDGVLQAPLRLALQR